MRQKGEGILRNEKAVSKKWLKILGIISGVYFIMKYIVPLIIPFLMAGLVTLAIHPLIQMLYKKTKLNRALLVGICLILVGGGLLFILWLFCAKLCGQLSNFVMDLDEYEQQLSNMLTGCCNYMEDTFGVNAKELEEIALENIQIFANHVQVNFFPKIMNSSVSYLKNTVEFFGVFIVTIISIVLLVKDYEDIMEKCRQYPVYEKIWKISSRIGSMGTAYLKAQLLIMFIISLICSLGLFFIGSPYALLLGVIVGILDSLPFIGTGIVLVPWAVFTVLQGNIGEALSILILYIVCALSREFLEPKLIGKKLGIYPIIIIMTIYIGIKLFGLSGIILGPLSLIIIYELIMELN